MASTPVFKGCPRCGGDLAAETISGMRALGCLHCDAVVLARADVAAMLAGDAATEEADTEEAPDNLVLDTPAPSPMRVAAKPNKGPTWPVTAAIGLFTAAGGLVLGALAVVAAGGNGARPPIDEPAVLGAVTEVAAPPAVVAPEVLAAPSQEPALPVEDVSAPASLPAADGPAGADSPPSSDLPKGKKDPLAQGWAAVDRGDWFSAKSAFEIALASRPADADANFGLGYVLFQLGNAKDARPYLCAAASTTTSVDTAREANGLLSQAGLACN